MIQKSAVIAAILEALQREFETYLATSKKTRMTGNDAQTKAEGKYDTRSIEENYLADGQAKHALVARQAMEMFARLPQTAFPASEPIGPGSLVELAFADENRWFLIAPAAGGLEVEVAGKTVTVLSPESPLGRNLADQRVGSVNCSPALRILQAF